MSSHRQARGRGAWRWSGWVPLVLALMATGCAPDAGVQRWVGRWHVVEGWTEAGRAAEAEPYLVALAASAPKPVDRTMVQMRLAELSAEAGRHGEAVARYGVVVEEAVRRMDRAMARYRIARLAETRGRHDAAVALYRRLVLTYPDLMPGWRALGRLQRWASGQGGARLEAHLQWTRAVYPRLRATTLGENLPYEAARLAHARFREDGEAAWATWAERLYRHVGEAHDGAELWAKSLWGLSWLLHEQGRYAEEVRVIDRIISKREVSLLIGNYEMTFYWVGRLRQAKLEMGPLGLLDSAAARLTWFLDTYTKSRWQDDAAFWLGCVHLRAGDPDAADAAFSRIPGLYADSKYLRRLDEARRAPFAASCEPPEWTEADW